MTRSASAIWVCAEGSFKDFYLSVIAALSNVPQTYVDSLNAMLIRITAQCTGVLFIAELCKLTNSLVITNKV